MALRYTALVYFEPDGTSTPNRGPSMYASLSDENGIELTTRVPYEGDHLDFEVTRAGNPAYVGVYLTLGDSVPVYRYFLSMDAAKDLPAPN